jgi:hypothetical protein
VLNHALSVRAPLAEIVIDIDGRDAGAPAAGLELCKTGAIGKALARTLPLSGDSKWLMTSIKISATDDLWRVLEVMA